jgi:iron complex transport system substrate-binding protein
MSVRTPAVLAALISLPLLAGSAVSALADPIVITDQEDREVKLDGPAQRIVTIPMPMASGVIALDGGASKLVGVNPLSLTAIREGILGKIFPDAGDITDQVTGTNFVPNVEALAAANPDLVIQWGGRGDDIVSPITNAGLNAMLIKYGTEDLTRQYMTMVATAIGKPERIGPLVEWRDQVEKQIEAKTSMLTEAQRPNVLYLGNALSSITATGDEGNYTAWYLKLVGARSASADLKGTVTINKEQIAQWNPDIILLNAFEPTLDVNWVYDDPILSLTKAAQAHRVYKMPLGGYRWDPPNQESPLTWMWLADLVHPELFNFDLRSEMKSAYHTLYNYQLSDADIDGILWMDKQGTAAGYASFKAP